MKVKVINSPLIHVENEVNETISQLENEGYSIIDIIPMGLLVDGIHTTTSVMIKFAPRTESFDPDKRI